MDTQNTSAGFYWTGHPFIDFGIATLMEWCGLALDEEPEQLTMEKLEEFAEVAEAACFTKPDLFKSVILNFGTNFFNPSLTSQQHHEIARKQLRSFQRPTNPQLPVCTFFNKPSVDIVARDTFPMLMGRTPINFYPNGRPGIAISGQAQTAIMALMFGALRSQGKLLVAEADDRNLLRAIVRDWVEVVQKRINLSRQGQELEDIAPPKTAMVTTLTKLEQARLTTSRLQERRYSGGITLYHFSNSGQGPSIEIYALPAPILTFVTQAQMPEYYPAWAEIRRRGWPKPKLGKKAGPLPTEFEPNQEQQRGLSNRFYNDLFGLPDNSKKFVHNYFLVTLRSLLENSVNWTDQRRMLGSEQIKAVWNLTQLFLEEVLAVRTERINDIKELSTRLADIVMKNAPLYKKVLQVRRNWPEVRRLLRQISRNETAAGRSPVVTLDQFLSIFEMGEDTEYVDWGLAWDLVLIKLMEELYRREFFGQHPEVAAFDPDEIEAEETSLAVTV